MKVSDIMSGGVITVNQDEPVIAAARLLKRYNLGALPVCDDAGRLRGMLTDRDIVLRCVATESDPDTTPVRDVMSRLPVTVNADDDVRQAANTMSVHQVRRLPVLKENRLVGILSLGDIAKSHTCTMEASHALSEISLNIRKR
jgi:CBS domain-containing protein